MSALDGALTIATQDYLSVFNSYATQFTQWGQWIFCGLLVINMMWFWLWLAFEKGEFDQALVQFLKKFFITMIFYTLMMKHDWLFSLLSTAQDMGKTITGGECDPSSIINNGIWISIKLLKPVHSFGLTNIGFGLINIIVTYFVVLFVFITVALRLSLVIVETTALISVSSFFLGFAALSATSKIANNILEAIIANCVKLLGIYLVVGTGMKVILNLANMLPQTEGSFDDYWWLLSAVLLFWEISKSLPDLLARIVGFAVSDHSHMDTAALVMASTRHSGMAKDIAKNIAKPISGAAGVAKNLVKSLIRR